MQFVAGRLSEGVRLPAVQRGKSLGDVLGSDGLGDRHKWTHRVRGYVGCGTAFEFTCLKCRRKRLPLLLRGLSNTGLSAPAVPVPGVRRVEYSLLPGRFLL
jgi:hypothetical protein